MGLSPDISLKTPNSGSREEDQYWSPLQIGANAFPRGATAGLNFETCIVPEASEFPADDPELSQAQQALNCWGVAQASGG